MDRQVAGRPNRPRTIDFEPMSDMIEEREGYHTDEDSAGANSSLHRAKLTVHRRSNRRKGGPEMRVLRRENLPLRGRVLVVVFALALLAFSGQAQAAWVTTFCDYFDTEPTGANPANWITHEQAPPSTDIYVDSTHYHGASGKSAKFLDSSGTWGCWLERAVSPAQTRIAVEWWQQQDSTLDTLGVVIVGAGPGGAVNVQPFTAMGFDPGRSQYTGWFIYTDLSGDHGIAGFAPRVWYRIRLEMDCASQTFNLYIWDSVGTLVSQILGAAFPASMTSISSYHFKAFGPTLTPHGAWVDGFCEQNWEAGQPPETWITAGPCGGSACPDYVSIGFIGADDTTPTASLRYRYRVDGGPGQGETNLTYVQFSSRFYELGSGPHLFEVWAVDADGNADPTPAQCSFTVYGPVPTVTIDSPYSGQRVKCVVRIQASVSDPSLTRWVEFYVNGVFWSRDYTAPYEYYWDTRPTAVWDGPATVSVQLADKCGRLNSRSVIVNVDNTSFNDVAKTDWHWLYVETIAASGITSGCSVSPLKYCPYANITRAQMAVFLCRVAGKAPLYRDTPTFCDVPKTNPYYGWIERLADPDSWNGNPPTIGCKMLPCRTYCPWSPVLREEMAAFLVRATGKLPMSSCAGIFCDVSTSSWACGYIARLADAASWTCGSPTTGITCPGGYPSWCRCFGAKQYVNRAQMAAFLVRAFCIPYYCSE